jgi:hypothetical protein
MLRDRDESDCQLKGGFAKGSDGQSTARRSRRSAAALDVELTRKIAESDAGRHLGPARSRGDLAPPVHRDTTSEPARDCVIRDPSCEPLRLRPVPSTIKSFDLQ